MRVVNGTYSACDLLVNLATPLTSCVGQFGDIQQVHNAPGTVGQHLCLSCTFQCYACCAKLAVNCQATNSIQYVRPLANYLRRGTWDLSAALCGSNRLLSVCLR
jgi:hypothetical protein